VRAGRDGDCLKTASGRLQGGGCGITVVGGFTRHPFDEESECGPAGWWPGGT